MSDIRNASDHALVCPKCNQWTGTHVDNVQVAARHEDGEFNEIAVNGISGEIVHHSHTQAPMGDTVKAGRRHRIALSGYCEMCGHEFALVFTQHKGTTHVEWTDANFHQHPGNITSPFDNGTIVQQ